MFECICLFFTFACMQIYFHGGVSPGVQDFPGNNILYRHPLKKKKKQENISLISQFLLQIVAQGSYINSGTYSNLITEGCE